MRAYLTVRLAPSFEATANEISVNAALPFDQNKIPIHSFYWGCAELKPCDDNDASATSVSTKSIAYVVGILELKKARWTDSWKIAL